MCVCVCVCVCVSTYMCVHMCVCVCMGSVGGVVILLLWYYVGRDEINVYER